VVLAIQFITLRLELQGPFPFVSVEDRIDLIAPAKIAFKITSWAILVFKTTSRILLLAGKEFADFQIRIGEIEGKSSREQFWEKK